MKTPFDTVIRTRRREIDRVRIAIHAQSSRIMEMEEASSSLHSELAQEYEVAAEQWTMSSHAYVRRKLAERAQLHASQLAAQQEIDDLRQQARSTYSSVLAFENAADRFRSDAQRKQMRAEQQATDDISSVRVARTALAAFSGRASGSR